jgi:hypothetical protein
LNIGEALANICVNKVERASSLEDGMMPLTQLEQWMTDRFCEDGKIPDPAERYFTYERKPEEGPPRTDIIIGFANYTPILSGYDNNKSEVYQTFAGFGAKPAFLYYYYENETELSAILDERNAIMDKLEAEALGERGSGREIGLVLGGAIGERCAYIDLLLYDEQAFIERARALLADTPYMIFCKEFQLEGEEFLLTDQSVAGFIERLQQLGDCDAPDKIVAIIEEIPVEQRDYTINSIFSRALNNIDEYQRALDVMETIREQGESDPWWHYRRGYALRYLDRDKEAEEALYRAKSSPNASDSVIEWADELLEMMKEHKSK